MEKLLALQRGLFLNGQECHTFCRISSILGPAYNMLLEPMSYNKSNHSQAFAKVLKGVAVASAESHWPLVAGTPVDVFGLSSPVFSLSVMN